MSAGFGSIRVRLLVALSAAALVLTGVAAPAHAADPCAGLNPVACENSKPGDAPSVWDIAAGWGAGDDSIQGFGTDISVDPGSTVKFKIKAATNAPYTIDIFRLGYYAGKGARRQASTITVSNPAAQPACITDNSTNNYDCGNWAVSSQWAVPATAVSGVYVATLNQGSDRSQITFIVRDDASHSDVIFKTSDATWQAYNKYGGSDFYTSPNGLTASQARAFKISYNRPFATRGSSEGRDFLFSNEYPTLRFLERNGVDISYTTDIDVSTGQTVLTNHKAFMSVGHDEYWTLPERTKVEAARDAGVNLMFLSGNEVYWHTRLEASTDGSSTPNRTLVCYKDSWEGAKLDPSSESTGTWRDPRFQPAPNGSNPENSLTGTIYMSNNTDLAITVSAAQGKARLWRGTSLASQAAGATATLAPHTIGYESDEDVDNGGRPAGLMRLTETTGPSPQKIQDPAGTQVAPGTTTHSLTLYRAASGALVFGAGTIQWGWGLDQYHDGDNSNPADSRMQQATLNMLADMDASPTTPMAGLTMPVKSADTQAPAVTVASPAAGASIANGSQVTVSGSAADAGGGIVTTVEVSLDGGVSYRRATGTTAWSYSGVLSGTGGTAIKVRASDDSANLSTPASIAVSVNCPCSLFGDRVPTTPATTDASAVELGVKFVPDADGFISGVRFYKGSGNTGTHTGTLWTSTGTAVGSGSFTNETATGWQTLVFGTAVPVNAGSTYVVSYFAPNGHYAADAGFFTASDFKAAPLNAPGRPSAVSNGVYSDGHRFPTATYGDTNYWVDVLYNQDDATPPTVTVLTPLSGASSVATTAKPAATFAGTVDPSSVTFGLSDSEGAAVVGSTSFNAQTRTVTFAPATALNHGGVYTASVNATSAAGIQMSAPVTWTFVVAMTDPLPGACPCTIWPDSATPATVTDSDTGNVELGVKFTAEVDGKVSGVRFYKGPQNLGTHTGSLWTATGALLGAVTFTGESSSGWQTAYFTSPVNVTGGATYIVSYRAPNGGYSFTTNGLSTAVDSPPLHALTGGGVYTYGSGAPLTTSSANYWVDLVFSAEDPAPVVSSTSPGVSATNVHVGAKVSSTFAAQIKEGTGTLVLKASGGTTVPGTVTYNATTRTFQLVPSAPLAAGATYSATVSGATALSGYAMEAYSWSFTTAGITNCPCTLFESSAVPVALDGGDSGAIEVGVGFNPSADGMITGIRFYKSELNTGTHTASLWSSTGAVLSTGTFSGESATGWQTLTFTQPVAVTAGTTYVASYFAPNGHYSVTSGFFNAAYQNGPLAASSTNGLYRYGSASGFPQGTYGSTNYYVDPIFSPGAPPDLTSPTVTATSPVVGSSSQSVAGTLTATFDEAVSEPSITLSLKDAAGTPVAGTTTYSGTTKTATFTSISSLTRGKTYTAAINATDLAGNAMVSAKTWTFTTANPDPVAGECPCSIWTDASTPAVISQPDSKAVELGMAFTADEAGEVTGVRFYKGVTNTGTHTASLWGSTGVRLATVTFGAETSEGWQTVLFSSPVTLTEGATYVVSYLAPNGNYSVTGSGLSSTIDAPPLHTLANGGRYVYGGGYPSSASNTNYWVDPIFETGDPAGPADTTAPVITGVEASGSGTSASVTWTTDESGTSVVQYGTSTSLGSTASGATGTAHSVALSSLTPGVMYYFRVTSADAAGNSAVSPAASGAPASFTMPMLADTTAPVISAVEASGSGTEASVFWTTDESGTSVVQYGTSASLGSTASGASATAHSVTLSGLTPGETYYYRVTSADPAANTTTSPATSGAPASFTMPMLADTTPPVISAVEASGSGTEASVSWTTDESGTSVVQYGTSTSLGLTAPGASGTAHSVSLSGLTPNTRYYYRVTSADPAANTTTSPATSGAPAAYVPTVAPITHSTVADFGTGSGAYVSDTSGGEVISTPTLGTEFAGTALQTGWGSTAVATGGTVAVAGGMATLNGSNLWSNSTYGSGRSVSAFAQLSPGQSLGWGSTATGSTSTRVSFVVTAAGDLTAVFNDGRKTNTTTAIPGSWTGAAHEYRIDRSTTTATIYIDGTQVATNTFQPPVSLRFLAVDPANDSTQLSLDWIRIAPYTASRTFTSAVINAGAAVGWDTMTADVATATGSTVTLRVRSGSTATPGRRWTSWTTVPVNGSIVRSARYLQYQIVTTTTGTRFVSSATKSVNIGFHVL